MKINDFVGFFAHIYDKIDIIGTLWWAKIGWRVALYATSHVLFPFFFTFFPEYYLNIIEFRYQNSTQKLRISGVKGISIFHQIRTQVSGLIITPCIFFSKFKLKPMLIRISWLYQRQNNYCCTQINLRIIFFDLFSIKVSYVVKNLSIFNHSLNKSSVQIQTIMIGFSWPLNSNLPKEIENTSNCMFSSLEKVKITSH